MGYVSAVGPCLVCRRIFSYNPTRVPSHPARDGKLVSDPSAPKLPICEFCIARINAERRKLGAPEWTVHADAYEAADESEVF
jgi:hypothetical protein